VNIIRQYTGDYYNFVLIYIASTSGINAVERLAR